MKDDFDEWYEQRGWGGYWDARLAWIAAQHAERKRIIKIIRRVTNGYYNCYKLIKEIDK